MSLKKERERERKWGKKWMESFSLFQFKQSSQSLPLADAADGAASSAWKGKVETVNPLNNNNSSNNNSSSGNFG